MQRVMLNSSQELQFASRNNYNAKKKKSGWVGCSDATDSGIRLLNVPLILT